MSVNDYLQMKSRITELMQSPDSGLRLLLCTEAYSMGADPANICNVVHIGPTNNIESLFIIQI